MKLGVCGCGSWGGGGEGYHIHEVGWRWKAVSVCGCNIGSIIENTDLQALHRAVDDRAKPDKNAQGDGDG